MACWSGQLATVEESDYNPFYPSIKREEDDAVIAYNELLKTEKFYKPPIDEFLNTSIVSVADIVVVLINFSVTDKGRIQGQFIPCEMALTAFSLSSGIIDNCVVYIRHPDKSMYPRTMEQSLKTLNIPPVQPSEKGKCNYNKAYVTLQLFRNKFPYVANDVSQNALLFCRRSEYDEVAGCLEFLYHSVGEGYFGFHVLPLEYLVSRMSYEMCFQDFKNRKNYQEPYDENGASGILDCNGYSGLTHLACTHHYKSTKGIDYCPMKIINGYAYNIIATLGDTKIARAGSHFPCKDGEHHESNRRQIQLLAWSSNPLCNKDFGLVQTDG